MQYDRRALHGGRFRSGAAAGGYRLESAEQSRRSIIARPVGRPSRHRHDPRDQSVKAGQHKQYQQGYDLGASDTVKRQY
jgi:hypothetical protein